ncbi:MAG TPA: carboxylesterase family protein [Kofleriaceae bacterium]|nr:carboxylesterase family protein [Kofleriaceae bacterium]
MKPTILSILLGVVACGGGGGGGDDASDAMPDAPAACAASAGPAGELVRTTSGALRGARDGATWAWKRVPYAAPPVGERRFRPPAPPVCPGEVLDATRLGPVCPQLDAGAFVGDEDCLHLNVWAPAAAGPARPVMVWIHGGGNSVGSAVYPLYDGRRLAEAGDVIVVTINYRLAQLGFLGHASFRAEAAAGQGTFGLLDQIAALAWVRDNIAAFGGDPSNVTIFGESAGARDVCALVAAPGAAGTFHRAIMQSGACKFLPARQAAEQQAAEVAAAVGCAGAADVPACLRALPAEALIRALPGDPSSLSSSPYNPMIDGAVLPDQPEAVIRAGNHHRVPFAIGANADETGNAAPAIPTEAQYQVLVRAQLPPALADAALAQYPASAYPSPRAAYVRLTSDLRFVCPSREIAKAVDAAQDQPVYRYFFQHRASPLGAVHGLDVPYVFGTFDAVLVGGQPYQPTATDLALSAAIQGYWTRFARGGDPGGAPAWPAYGPSDPALVLDAAISTATAIRQADCDFWAPFYNAL